MHVDVASTFPLNEMLAAHMKHRGLCTMLSTKVRMLWIYLFDIVIKFCF